MPIYEYICDDCKSQFEKIVINRQQEISCPSVPAKKPRFSFLFSVLRSQAAPQNPPPAPQAAEAVAAAVAAATNAFSVGSGCRPYLSPLLKRSCSLLPE